MTWRRKPLSRLDARPPMCAHDSGDAAVREQMQRDSGRNGVGRVTEHREKCSFSASGGLTHFRTGEGNARLHRDAASSG
jgi:hypothetical protein